MIWVIGGWRTSAVVVEKSTRDRCVMRGDATRAEAGDAGARDGTGDVDARVASRESRVVRTRTGGRASVVCVCVCDSRARRASGRRVRARVGGSDSDSRNESAPYRSIAEKKKNHLNVM